MALSEKTLSLLIDTYGVKEIKEEDAVALVKKAVLVDRRLDIEDNRMPASAKGICFSYSKFREFRYTAEPRGAFVIRCDNGKEVIVSKTRHEDFVFEDSENDNKNYPLLLKDIDLINKEINVFGEAEYVDGDIIIIPEGIEVKIKDNFVFYKWKHL